MIKAVIFDVDNTLYNYDEAHEAGLENLRAYVKEQFGWPGDFFMAEYKKAMKEIHSRVGEVSTIHSRIIRFAYILEKHGLPLHPYAMGMCEAYWKTMIGSMNRMPGTEDVLKGLKEKGLRIGIGTDMTSWIQLRKLEHLGLLQYIDFTVSSEEAGVEKPGEELFRLCMQKAGAEASECLFVGDNLKKDYMGACAAGMQAVWFVPPWIAEQENQKAIRMIRDLKEIPELDCFHLEG